MKRFVFIQAYTQYAVWDCEFMASKAEKMLLIPLLACLLWLLTSTLAMIAFAIFDDLA